MKRINTLLMIFVMFVKFTNIALADENTVTGSAVLVNHANTYAPDDRSKKLRDFLVSQNSPLADYSEDFVYWADQYGLDYRLIPSITGVESSFGKRMPKNSFNAYGWNSGNYSFESWPQSIQHVSFTLKNKYYDNGANNIQKISRRYAPPSKTWARNVKYFMKKIDPTLLSYEY